jgi:DNA polymerase-3 subunit epsilon
VGRATQPIAFVDVETTGGRAALHRITEIAIIGMDAGEVQWRWSSLVNPGVRIPSGIERLTGITNEMVAEAPEFSALAPEISRRLEGRRFVAHNARFDYGFVRNEFRRIGRSFTAPVTCTVRLSRALFPDSPRHSLDAIMSRHGLECDRRHRALPDAEVLAQFWQLLLQSQSSQTLEAAIDEVSRRPSLPSHLSADLLDDLPDGPGVYRFWGESEAEGETLLYVGKANNLRERVLSHFGVALRDGKAQRLAQQVRRVDWHETAGELGALLLEARWVKEQQPVYNRRLRGGAEQWSWYLPSPTATPQLYELRDAWPSDGDLYGLYRSAKDARKALGALADEAKLCKKILGLERGQGSCFGFQVGRCTGVCVDKELPVQHALRTGLALARQKVRRWPWPGAVAIEECNHFGLREWHVLDCWRYLGSIRVNDDEAIDPMQGFGDLKGADLISMLTSVPAFDIDTYRIVSRTISKSKLQVHPWPIKGAGSSEEGRATDG